MISDDSSAKSGPEYAPEIPHPAARGEVTGLPAELAPGCCAALIDNGRQVAIADGARLAVYELSTEDGGTLNCRAGRAVNDLPGEATALAESGLGLLVAVRRNCGGDAIVLLDDNAEPAVIHETPDQITALAASGGDAYAVTTGSSPSLVRVSIRQRAEVDQIGLVHSDIQLEPRDTGGLLLLDRRKHETRMLTRDLREECPAPHDDPSTCSCPEWPVKPHCGCRPTKPPECGCRDPHDRPPHDERSDDTPGRPTRPPTGGDDGGPAAAVPTPGGGIVVGIGDRVEHEPPKGSVRPRPCGRSLFYSVETLRRVGAYYLAADAGGRTMTLLSADMNIVDEWFAGRRGGVALTAPTTTRMLTLRGGAGWAWADAHLLYKQLRPSLDRHVVETLTEKVFYGRATHVMSYGQPTTPTKVKALLLPVIEGNQTFSSPNLNGFGAFIGRTVTPRVRDYYDENSFGKLTDVTLDVFGAGVGPTGGPLRLPRPQVHDYYFPTYDPARAELTRTGLSGSESITLDGRESLVIQAKPLNGGPSGKTITLKFFALGFRRDEDLFPVQIRFAGSEKLTLATTLPDGSTKSIVLNFPAKLIDIADDSQVAAKLTELAGYLDTVMATAETAAGIAPRVFAAPAVARIRAIGRQFGSLVVTISGKSTSGGKLAVTSATSTGVGVDPIGLGMPLRGHIPVTNTAHLERYLNIATQLAQDAAGAGFNDRYLNPASATFVGGTLTTRIPIADRYGGPGATVDLTSSLALESLFSASTSKQNSATTTVTAQALRDRSEMYQDAFSAAVAALRAANMPTDIFGSYTCILILPVEPATPDPADPNAVLPSENWNVTGLFTPFPFRGAENMTTVKDKVNDKIQAQTAWSLIFMPAGMPDTPMIVHEVGHALGFGDIYHEDGYRDELDYLGDWAMMDAHWHMPHHCGYHKLQARWIPDNPGTPQEPSRVFEVGLPKADETQSWEMLLVPVEVWRNSLIGSARTAFGVGSGTPVVQLGYIDFGGDGSTFGLIEARGRGARYSQSLPGDGLLITNCVSWTVDQRFAVNNLYRRNVQWLNEGHVLRNAGDSFDLAFAPELPMKGVTVEVVDTELVEGSVTVYRVKVTRQNAAFVDLYFDNPPVYYRNPDLWVDWPADNKPTDRDVTPAYPVGQPADQGQTIYVPPKDFEKYWVVARLRNRGEVKATDVKVNFFYFDPAGAGDGMNPMDPNKQSAYHLIGSTTHPEVQGKDVPALVLQNWDVPAGFGGHTCLMALIEDYRIPEDSHGAALGSTDVWEKNNHAQKNVSKFEAKKSSPFAPIEFEFSVRNEGVGPEVAYLEPDGLPFGYTLAVSPPIQTIPAKSTVRFHCRVELDDAIVEAGCENDQRFRIHAWRQDAESSARWGGVEYEVRPRQRTAISLKGIWDSGNRVEFTGTVTPNPGGGTVRLRVSFGDHAARWFTTPVSSAGGYVWSGTAPADSFIAEAVAWYDGSRTHSTARSVPVTVKHPPIVH